jgi:hypothetical protein
VDKFSEAIVNAISQKLLLGDVSVEKALDVLMSHLLDKHHSGMRITFFFPEYTSLKPVSVRGTPPRVGEKVYLRQLTLPAEEECNYSSWMDWTVKRVDYSVTPNTKPVETLRMLTYGEEPNSYEAQVMLYKGRKWSSVRRRLHHERI